MLSSTHKKVLKALEECNGVVSYACKKAGIARKTYHQWYNEIPEFRVEADKIQEVVIDFVENKLFEKVREGNITAIIFFLKTRGKKRGYTETLNIETNTGNSPVNITPIKWVKNKDDD